MSFYKVSLWLVSNHQNPSAATLKFTFSEMYGSIVEESLIYSFPSPIFSVGSGLIATQEFLSFPPPHSVWTLGILLKGCMIWLIFFFKFSCIQKKYYCKDINIGKYLFRENHVLKTNFWIFKTKLNPVCFPTIPLLYSSSLLFNWHSTNFKLKLWETRDLFQSVFRFIHITFHSMDHIFPKSKSFHITLV